MTSIKEGAEEYTPQSGITIADLEAVSVKQEIKSRQKKNRDGEEYIESYVTIEGKDYRVPNSVLEQLQTILKEVPELKVFKVSKKGIGMDSKYTVIQLE